MMDVYLTIRDADVTAARVAPTVAPMLHTTLLTKRRAVDHCRVRSALCRMR
ncbi:hypothetical protein CLV56_1363 [Mumia flava]|uniref:Uncharacterized protein n=1 Tax=Mumia flava TaxID=1348852 RepID=A0A2M9BGS2_9ACTN|nr:hypothetical protein CLV56_1363 [Mumia flava]